MAKRDVPIAGVKGSNRVRGRRGERAKAREKRIAVAHGEKPCDSK